VRTTKKKMQHPNDVLQRHGEEEVKKHVKEENVNEQDLKEEEERFGDVCCEAEMWRDNEEIDAKTLEEMIEALDFEEKEEQRRIERLHYEKRKRERDLAVMCNISF